MRSKITAAGLAILAIGAMVATSGVATAGAATTLTMMADQSDKPGLDAVIYNFERTHPGIKVRPSYLAFAQRAQLLSTQFQAGNAPDVLVVLAGSGFPPSVFSYAKAGYLDPISSARLRDQSVPAFVKSVLTVKGKVYARPINGVPSVMMDNMTLLKRLGIKRPETLSEMVAACRSIRAKAPNVTPITWPGQTQSLTFNFTLAQAMSEVYAKTPRWDQLRNAGKVKFQTTPGWRTAVGNLKRLIDAKCFGPGVASETFTQSVTNMVNQKSAIVFAGTQVLGLLRSTTKNNDKYGMFQIPQKSKAKTYVPVSPAAALAVNAKSGNIAAAREFVDFAARPDQNRIYAHLISVAPVLAWGRVHDRAIDKNGNTKADQRASIKTLGKDFAWAVPFAPRVVVNQSYTWPAADIAVTMAQQALGLFTGQSSVDSVLKAADAAWDKAIKK